MWSMFTWLYGHIYGSMVTITLGEFDTIEASKFNGVKMEWLLALHTPMLLFIANSETQHD